MSSSPVAAPVSTGLLDSLPDESVAVVLGTRPEMVKLSGVIKLLGRLARVVHTGQHYDATMSELFFDEMTLPRPHVRFEVGGRTRQGRSPRHSAASRRTSATTGRVLSSCRATRTRLSPARSRATPSSACGARRSRAAQLRPAHARGAQPRGDRSPFRSAVCGARGNVVNLAREGISGDHVVLTGNTVVEAVHAQPPPPATRMSVLDACDLRPDGYAVATLQRPENTDDPNVLATILTELGRVGVPVVLSLHPRTATAVEANGLRHLLNRLVVPEPRGSGDFLSLVKHAALVITDSGGLQAECTVLQRPFIAVRRLTERAESIGKFGTLVEAGDLIGKTANNWLDNLGDVLAELSSLPSPYGDGTASERIVNEMAKRLC